MLILISETVESVEQGSELSFHGDWPASCLSVVGVFVTLCVNSLSNSSHRLREQITLSYSSSNTSTGTTEGKLT